MTEWTRGPYGGEGWALVGGNFVTEHGLSPLSTGESQLLQKRILSVRGEILRASRLESCPARMIGAIGWSETRLQNLGANSAGASGMFGILPSTASWLAGRSVSASELAADSGLSARLCARYLVRAADATGYACTPINLPILASAYNAGYGSGKIRQSSSTPFRMVYDRGADGGYLPRVMRAYNAIGSALGGFAPRRWLLAVAAVGAGAAGGLLLARRGAS